MPTPTCLTLLLSAALPLVSNETGARTPVIAGKALDAALRAIDERTIAKDITFIASDDMGGRDTPSAGLEATAHYLVERLEKLEFQPGAPHGYLYEYPLIWNQIDEEGSELVITGKGKEERFVFGTDYFLGRGREITDHRVEGGLVDIGDGSKKQIAEVDLEGRWALCREGDGSVRWVGGRVASAGGVGVVFTPGDGYDDKAYPERFDFVSDWLRRGSLRKPRAGEKPKTVFPAVYLTREAGERLLKRMQRDKSLELREVRRRTFPGGRRMVNNVCGFWPGDDPALADEVIILSAHYDHVGTRDGKIYNGADDNGSGTSGLLALAQALKSYGPMRRSVLLMWVSAEEKGLWGSEAWARRPWLPEGCYPVADINIDMIGRNDPEELLVTPTKRLAAYNGLTKLVEELGPEEGFTKIKSADEYWARSDHMNFDVHLELPVAFLFADVHADYHRPSDTIEKIDTDKVRRVTRLVMRMLDALQAPELELHERPTPGREAFQRKVRRADCLRDLEGLRMALERYRGDRGSYPERLTDLTQEMAGGPWIAVLPVDPWGNAYVYSAPGEADEAPGLMSLGADGEVGGDGGDSDVEFE